MDYHAFAAEYARVAEEVDSSTSKERQAAQDAYNEGVRGAERTRTEQRNKANEQYEESYKATLDLYNKAVAARDTKKAEAQQELTQKFVEGNKGEGVSLLTWMIEKNWWGNYQDHCIAILDRLPATAEELVALSSNKGWCGTFDEFLDQALADNAIPGVSALEAATFRVRSALQTRSNSSITTAVEALLQLIPQDAATVTDSEKEKVEA
jgi:hypothetical protein